MESEPMMNSTKNSEVESVKQIPSIRLTKSQELSKKLDDITHHNYIRQLPKDLAKEVKRLSRQLCHDFDHKSLNPYFLRFQHNIAEITHCLPDENIENKNRLISEVQINPNLMSCPIDTKLQYEKLEDNQQEKLADGSTFKSPVANKKENTLEEQKLWFSQSEKEFADCTTNF